MSVREIYAHDQVEIDSGVRYSISPEIFELMTNPPKDALDVLELGATVLSACVNMYGGSIDSRLPLVKRRLIQVSADYQYTRASGLDGDTEGSYMVVAADGRWFSHVLSCEVVVRGNTVARFSGKRNRDGITTSEAVIMQPDIKRLPRPAGV